VRPVFERLVAEGLIGGWGLTGIGYPDTIIQLLREQPKPAAVQCIANLLDSPGALKFFNGPAKPRAVIAAAKANGVAVMGIRAVQAGALTAAIDRDLPAGHAERRDYERAARFRRLCAELGANPAVIAHRYALAIDGIDTLVLGCTHYPLFKSVITRVIDSDIRLIDSATETAKEVEDVLEKLKWRINGAGEGLRKFYVTDLPSRFETIGKRFLGNSLQHAVQVRVGGI